RTPPATEAPLLPYTTLFRSDLDGASQPAGDDLRSEREQAEQRERREQRTGGQEEAEARLPPEEQEPGDGSRASASSWPPVRCSRSEEHTSELQSLRHLVCRL